MEIIAAGLRDDALIGIGEAELAACNDVLERIKQNLFALEETNPKNNPQEKRHDREAQPETPRERRPGRRRKPRSNKPTADQGAGPAVVLGAAGYRTSAAATPQPTTPMFRPTT